MQETKISLYKSIGFYILSIYVFLTYIPQISFHIIFHQYFLEHYNGANKNPFLILIILLFFYISIVLVNEIFPKIRLKVKFSDNINLLMSILSFILIFLFLIASIKFYTEYTISFRATHRLRETSLIIKILFFLREFAWFYVFYQLVNILRGNKLNFIIRFNLFLILIAWVLSLTASLSIPLVFIILLILLFNNKLLIILTNKNISGFKFFIISIFAIVFVLFAIFFGYANKFGMEKAYVMFSDSDLMYYLFSRTLARLSTSYEAAIQLFSMHFQDFNIQLMAVNGFIDTFLSRLASITHLFDYHVSDIETINRMNFFILFTPLHWHLEFAGASPGLLATIFYIPVFPFNFLFIALYVVIIMRATNRYIPNRFQDFNIFGKFILLYLIFRLFEAPLDIFYIIEPKFFFVILFLLGSQLYQQKEGIS
jgi:hypothetical protein